MLWAVAGRFGFSEAEIFAMPISRLSFWYDGHLYMVSEERSEMQRMTGVAHG